MDEILRALGLSMQELPESIRVYIKAVSSVATTLGISDSELTRCEEGFIYYLKTSLKIPNSFYPAIRDILKDYQSAAKRKEAERQAYEALITKLREAIAILNEAQQLYTRTHTLSQL